MENYIKMHKDFLIMTVCLYVEYTVHRKQTTKKVTAVGQGFGSEWCREIFWTSFNSGQLFPMPMVTVLLDLKFYLLYWFFASVTPGIFITQSNYQITLVLLP